MELIPPQLIAFCLRFIPIVLVGAGILGLFGIAGVGPRELPKKHETNRYIALTFITMAIGMWFLPVPGIMGTLGIAVAGMGLLAYTLMLRQARQEFPAMSQEQWLEVVKRRYKFASFGSQQPEGDDADDQAGEAE